MLIQIYEITNSEEANAISELGVDHIGVLVGKGKYPRELNFNQARKIFQSLPMKVTGIALSLSSTLEEIIEVIEKTEPDIIHIGTTPDNILPADILKLKFSFPELITMRSFPITGEESLDIAKGYDGIADWLLLDTYKQGDEQIGAVGEVHDWQISKQIVTAVRTPVILAGGLGPDNVAKAIKIVCPAGVDSKTKTDKACGHGKDLEKVRIFIESARFALE